MKKLKKLVVFSLILTAFIFAGCNHNASNEHSTPSTYIVTVENEKQTHKVEADKTTNLKKDDTVNLTITASDGWELCSLIIQDESKEFVTATVDATDTTKYSFTMPESNVTVTPVFKKDSFVEVHGTTVSGKVTESMVFIKDRIVKISDLLVCEHELTQAEYSKYCKLSASASNGKGDNFPAYNVNWFDAIVYCNLKSIDEGLTPAYELKGEKDPTKWPRIKCNDDGKYNGPDKDDIDNTWSTKITFDTTADGYRLPTEVEWEYIARGGSTQITKNNQFRYSGSDLSDDVAWYRLNSDSTHEVKGKAPNILGIYDMSGNVAEWCWDFNGDRSPTATTEPTGPASATTAYGISRVIRGGSVSVSFEESHCRVGKRWYLSPRAYEICGIRLVRSSK